jgi:hypothetical protein
VALHEMLGLLEGTSSGEVNGFFPSYPLLIKISNMAIENPLLMVFPLKSTSSSKVFGESLPNKTVFSCLQRFGDFESLAAERQVPACVHTPSQRENGSVRQWLDMAGKSPNSTEADPFPECEAGLLPNPSLGLEQPVACTHMRNWSSMCSHA